MKNLLADLTLPGGYTIPEPDKFIFADSDIGTLLTKATNYILAAVGIGLLLMLISAGFTLMTSAGDAKKMEMGKQQITNAIIGFIIVITAYWIVQIAGYIFGIKEIGSIFH